MYLRIRSALRAYGVPWNSQLPVHPLHKLILPSSASVIYLFLLEHSYKPLSITTVWAKDLNEDVHVLFSDQVWVCLKESYDAISSVSFSLECYKLFVHR